MSTSLQLLREHLGERGLLASTQEKYVEILDSAGDSNLLEWIQQKAQEFGPIGTFLPARAAVKHYLIAVEGYSAEDLSELLPKAEGEATQFREALSSDQLALYHAAVDEIEQEPAHTILSLLPKTGLRISEACSLHRDDLQLQGSSGKLRVGRGRKVPILSNATALLRQYVEIHQPKGWLFLGYGEAHIGPHAIRKYTRRIAARHPELNRLSPMVLRHTFAVMALRQGVPLADLQHILGHGSQKTTARYLQG